MAGAGATYLFGTYSSEIKTTIGYDQTTINLLGFSKDLGGSIGVLSGLVAEVTPTWFVLLLGAALNFGGYFMIWLAVTEKIPKPKVWQMCIYIIIGANSQNFANTGALVVSVKNFPESRGSLIGLLKGYAGLSGAIVTQIYLAVHGNDSKSLILLVGWLPAAISIVFVYTIRPLRPVKHPNEGRVFHHFLLISIVLAVFLMAITLTEKVITFSKAAYAGITTLNCGRQPGQIGESLGYPNKTVTSFVSLVSIWNFLGRVFSGFVSEILIVKYKLPRPLMMAIVLLISCVGYLLVAFPAPGTLYVASIIIGFSFGAQLPLIFAIISELFGLKFFSTLFNCGQLASPLGSYILNVKLTGPLYDRKAMKDLTAKGLTRSQAKELTCIGPWCYRLPFIILTSVTFIGALSSLVLVARTRTFYKSDIYKKFKENTDNI
ncbi:hypothetical protein Golob_010038 [Gossypium lobatum]|uniref:Nodulin-like domain-containing protein n=1 Tax=Gossypium lobatum TaxID=34289 RepID=A0A7J8MK97_9ROSI|nr:hypothetical protein [Gossypium lobatum]